MKLKRLLILPGNSMKAIGELTEFIKYIINKKYDTVTVYVAGTKNTIEVLGRNLPRKYLRENRVVIYRLNEKKDWGAQVLRIFLTALPDIIIYFLRELGDEELFKTQYFHLLGSRSNKKIVSYTIDNNYVSLGEIYSSIGELKKKIEEYTS